MVLEGLSELRIESNLLLGILTEISLAPSTQLLPPLRDRLLAAEVRATKAVAKLAKTEHGAALKSALQTLVALGNAKTGIPAERERELKTIAQGWELVDTARAKSLALTGDVEQVAREAREQMSSSVAASSAAISNSKTTLIAINSVGFLALLGGWIFISRNVVRRLHRLNGAITGLAAGNLEVEVPKGGRDELTDMAGAVETFKANAIAKLQLEKETEAARLSAEAERARREAEKAEEARQAQVTIAALAQGLDRLAHGDLLCQIDTPFAPDAEKLRTDFNAAVGKLKETMLAVVTSTQAIGSGTEEMSSAADDLSRRTEQQAASLEETAAALDEITATVKKAAEGATHARDVVATAKDDAERSGDGRARGGRGHGRDREVLAPDRPDHRRDRRDRLPDQPAGAQRRRRGGARRRRRPRLRGRRLRGAGAGPALGRGRQGDQGPDLGLDDAGRPGRQPGGRDRQGAGAHRHPGRRDQRRGVRDRRRRAGAVDRPATRSTPPSTRWTR